MGQMADTRSSVTRRESAKLRDGDRLRALPLFSSLDAAVADRLAARCRFAEHEPDAVIVDHQDPSTDVRFVLTGDVRVVMRVAEGREYILNDGGPGDFFGELSAIDGGGRSASVIAVTRAQTCSMPATVFREAIDADPQMRWTIMERLAGLIRRLSEKVTEYSFLQAKHRIYSELLRMSVPRQAGAKSGAKSEPDERVVSPPPVQRELADRIGSRREVVSRVLSELERGGTVSRTRGALVIRDVPRLRALIREGWGET